MTELLCMQGRTTSHCSGEPLVIALLLLLFPSRVSIPLQIEGKT